MIVCIWCDKLLLVVITQVPEDRTGVYGKYDHGMQHTEDHFTGVYKKLIVLLTFQVVKVTCRGHLLAFN